MTLISVADAEALLELVARVSDPTLPDTLADRKRNLLAGLRRLVQADAWIWLSGRMNLNVPGDSMATSMIDDGWSPQERVAALGVMTDPQHTAVVFRGLHEDMAARRLHTMSRDQLMNDDAWQAHPTGQAWRATGFDHFLVSSYPVAIDGYSAIGLHRRLGRPSFSDRERTLVHLLWQSVEWLHREGGTMPASDKVISLSPRERQELLLMLGGDSQQQLASRLQLPEHNIAEDLAGIYTKLGVASEGELLALFTPGNS